MYYFLPSYTDGEVQQGTTVLKSSRGFFFYGKYFEQYKMSVNNGSVNKGRESKLPIGDVGSERFNI